MIPTIQTILAEEEFCKKYERALPYEHLSQDLTLSTTHKKVTLNITIANLQR